MEHKYLVKWEGYSAKDNTWEPRKNLQGCEALIADYMEDKARAAQTTKAAKRTTAKKKTAVEKRATVAKRGRPKAATKGKR